MLVVNKSQKSAKTNASHSIKTWISNKLCTTRFWNNHHQVTLKIERMESKMILSFGSKKTKESKQEIQNRLRSCMPGRGEP